jgi:hypothetical protein
MFRFLVFILKSIPSSLVYYKCTYALVNSERFPLHNSNNNNNNIHVNRYCNVIKKESEKILKYKDLTIEKQHMWNIKAKMILVIIGATGTISKSFGKHVSEIAGKHDVKELQKAAILGTAHILRKVLM